LEHDPVCIDPKQRLIEPFETLEEKERFLAAIFFPSAKIFSRFDIVIDLERFARGGQVLDLFFIDRIFCVKRDHFHKCLSM
jgi:hypothetical protein